MVVDDDNTRRQLFTIEFFKDDTAAMEYIHSLPGVPDELEFDDSKVLNSRYLPNNPYAVFGCIDYRYPNRYRYFYFYDD